MTKLLPAPLFAVSPEWERNGYDDSDFYRVMYDFAKDRIFKYETGSTRYGNGYYAAVTDDYAQRNGLHGYKNYRYDPKTGDRTPDGILVPLPVQEFVPLEKTPESVLQRAEELLAEAIFRQLKSAEELTILEPENAEPGDILRLNVAHKSRKAHRTLEPGTRIRVNDCRAFGTFYRNGYNQPGRRNRSVTGTVVGNPSQLVRVPLEKCRLDIEPMPDSELRSRATELAKYRRFEQLFPW